MDCNQTKTSYECATISQWEKNITAMVCIFTARRPRGRRKKNRTAINISGGGQTVADRDHGTSSGEESIFIGKEIIGRRPLSEHDTVDTQDRVTGTAFNRPIGRLVV